MHADGWLQFHHTTLALVERPTTVNPDHVALLDACEGAYGLPFPAAVREWYALEHAPSILEDYGVEHHWSTLADLYADAATWSCYGWPQLDLATRRMLPLLWENQASFLVTIHLDGSADPPVFGWDNRRGWQAWAPHFSTFLAGWVWSWYWWGQKYACRLAAHEQHLAARDVAYLRTQFREQRVEPRVTNVYHFYGPDQHIAIWRNRPDQVGWWVFAGTAAGLLDVTRAIWACGTLASTLTIGGGGGGNCGVGVLATLRNETEE